ncbi:hypothetical protein EZV62_000217 [Acer yangbiense]|uniref:Uncharacterized protein n=1 Tax=Acer yangbiense TaxID=1000413 RepID=A0A5C7IRA7_9ROSI|nr:hypothetical protein EZV62_000217 [Acer yangbiense]
MQRENMASEKGNARDLEASTSSNQVIQPNTKGAASNSNVGKALARRALSGSQNRRSHGRKVANSGARMLPSRLSKVSLAEEDSTD